MPTDSQPPSDPPVRSTECSAAPDCDDGDYDYDDPTCGMCGDDGWIMLSDAGPSEWGEDCFCEVDRPIECPECRDRRRYEAQKAKRQNEKLCGGASKGQDA